MFQIPLGWVGSITTGVWLIKKGEKTKQGFLKKIVPIKTDPITAAARIKPLQVIKGNKAAPIQRIAAENKILIASCVVFITTSLQDGKFQLELGRK